MFEKLEEWWMKFLWFCINLLVAFMIFAAGMVIIEFFSGKGGGC